MLNIAEETNLVDRAFLYSDCEHRHGDHCLDGNREARGKPNWWGILLIVPGGESHRAGYLAWAD